MIILYILFVVVMLMVINIGFEMYLEVQDDIDHWLNSNGCTLYKSRDVPIFSRWWIHHHAVEDHGKKKVGYSNFVMWWKLYKIKATEKQGYDMRYYLEDLSKKSSKIKTSWWK